METWSPDLERYRPVALLKEGRFSLVSLIRDATTLKHMVARMIRVPPGTSFNPQKTFENAAEQLKALDHPRLPAFVDSFFQADNHWFVFDFVDGGTAAEYAEADSPVGTRWIVLWTSHALAALEYLHAQEPPFIVGSIEPSDLIVGQNGARLVDLGLFRHVFPEAAAMYSSGRDPAYVAPELRNAPHATPTGDVYSVGAVAFRLLAGQPPLVESEAGATDLAMQLMAARPDLPEAVRTVLMDMLAFYPSQRPATAKEAADRLRPGLRLLPPAPPLPLPAPPRDWRMSSYRSQGGQIPVSTLEAARAAFGGDGAPATASQETREYSLKASRSERKTGRIPRIEEAPSPAPAAATAVAAAEAATPAAPEASAPFWLGILDFADDWSWLLFQGDIRKKAAALIVLVAAVLIVGVGGWIQSAQERARQAALPSLMTLVSGKVQVETGQHWAAEDRVTRAGSLVQSLAEWNQSVMKFGSEDALSFGEDTIVRCGGHVTGRLSLALLQGRIWLRCPDEGAVISVPGAQVTCPAGGAVELDARGTPGQPPRTLVVGRAGSVAVKAGKAEFSLGPGQALSVPAGKGTPTTTDKPPDDAFDGWNQQWQRPSELHKLSE